MRFPDFSSWAGKDSSIYCSMLWSTVFATRGWGLGRIVSSPVGIGSGNGAVPPPQKTFGILHWKRCISHVFKVQMKLISVSPDFFSFSLTFP